MAQTIFELGGCSQCSIIHICWYSIYGIDMAKNKIPYHRDRLSVETCMFHELKLKYYSIIPEEGHKCVVQ